MLPRARPRSGTRRPLGLAAPARRRGAGRDRADGARTAAALRRRVAACWRARPGCRRGTTSFYVYRRLEARGEIRGGRFVDGFSGEQYALPEAVAALREIRRQPADGRLISLSGADPLNLTGIVTPGERVAAQAGNRVLYRDGVPAAISAGGSVRYFAATDTGSEGRLRSALLRTPAPSGSLP